MSAPKFSRALLGLAVIAVAALIPYGHAALTGTPEPGLAGLAALRSAAQSVYCAKGLTPTGIVLLTEIAVLLAAVLAGYRLRALRWLTEDGWYWVAVLALIALPFIG